MSHSKRENVRTPDDVVEYLRLVIGGLISSLSESHDKKLYELLMSSLDHALVQYTLEMEENQVGAANLLGISRNTLKKKMEKYDLMGEKRPRQDRRSS